MAQITNVGCFKIALVTMPFAGARLPSIALTQLRSVLQERLGERVESNIHYLNQDFIQYFGQERYRQISESVKATVSGLGDWLFRRVAFPHLDDNLDEYAGRYGSTLAQARNVLGSHEAACEELGIYLDKLIDRYALHRYPLVGFSSMFAQNVASFAMAKRLKRHNPKIITVMGGANCETTMGGVIARNVEAIDFVFSGPALKTFPRFVECLLDGRIEDCHTITGVLSSAKLSGLAGGNCNEIGEDLGLETRVPLDYTDFLDSLENKSPGTEPSLLFETSRGCWWGERSHCTFCGLNGTTMNYRAMPPEQALDQFDKLFAYSSRVSRFESVDNILPRQYLKTVLPHVNPPRHTRIFYEVKADLKDHEMQVLARAGVTELQPGIEALASSTLKLMNKGTTSFQNLRFLKSCLVYGIEPVWNLLIGFPGEEETVYEKYLDDLPSLTHLPPPSGVYPVRFDRYSPYHTMADEYGLDLKPYDFYSLVYPFSAEELQALAYFFADANYDNPYIARTAKWLKKLEASADHWLSQWQQLDSRPRLIMEWRGDREVVCDTRSSQMVEHDLGPAGLEVLSALARPLDTERLAKQLSAISDAALARQIESLRDRRLIFEEDARYLSLVISTEREQGYL